MMFVATMAFHAKISDPGIGGTYMTLLNTVANFGKFGLDYVTLDWYYVICSLGGTLYDVCLTNGISC